MQFFVTITHSQISVFDPAEPDFNLWNNDNVAQGFAWREGHVSFGVPDHDGQCVVETRLVESFPSLDNDALRAIRVPLSSSDNPYIATIVDEYETDVPAGKYVVEFRLMPGNPDDKERPSAFLIDFFFMRSDQREFSILKHSGEMTSDKVLTRTALPAN